MRKVLIIAAMLAIGAGGVAAYSYYPTPKLYEYRVEVEPGQTLWSICAKIASDKDDLREVIDRAKRENDIKDPANLQPGTEIKVKVRAIE